MAALVVGGGVGSLNFGQLDIKAVHAVEFHFQGGQAGALALPRFQRQQKFVAVVLDAAQFVELGVKAVVDDGAFAQPHRRLGQYGSLKALGNGFALRENIGQSV